MSQLSSSTDRTNQLLSNLYWWIPSPRYRIIPRKLNLGDALSPFIVGSVLRELAPRAAIPRSDSRLLAIGSILNHARTGNTLWGTGFNGRKPRSDYQFEWLDVRAVRGPKTRGLLLDLGIDCPEIYGDPGILIARYIKPRAVEKKSGPLVIPHYSESKEKYGRYRTIDTKGSDFQTFVDTIAQSEIVISSSLHGLIIAETYSVPVVLLLTSGKETLDKYEDYYLGTGRSQFPVAKTVEEALRITPCSPPDLHQIQENLVKAFPIDQWLKLPDEEFSPSSFSTGTGASVPS